MTLAAVDRTPTGASEDSLSTGLCTGFGFGTMGVAVMLNSVSIYFPALMATALGQSTAIAGTLITISKLYDLIADFTIGTASDRTRSRWGRRRPYLLAGAVVSALSLILIFNPPAIDGKVLIAYMLGMLVIYSTGYSLFNVPYLAMPGEMTDSYHERTRLLSYRTFFVSVGQIATSAAAVWILQRWGGGTGGYAIMGYIMAAFTLFAMVISFFGTAKARTVERDTGDRLAFVKQLRLLAQNRPLVLLLCCKLCAYVSLASTSSTGLLFLLNVLKVGYAGQLNLVLATNIAIAASMPVWVRLGRQFGKRNSYFLAAALNIVGALSWLLASEGEAMPWIWVRGAISGFAAGGMLLMTMSMLPDTMEYDRQRTGHRREGVFSSMYAIVEKLAWAVSPFFIGLYINAMGYIPTKAGKLVDQPHSAKIALYTGMAVLPAVAILCSIGCIYLYRLDEKTLRAHKAV